MVFKLLVIIKWNVHLSMFVKALEGLISLL